MTSTSTPTATSTSRPATTRRRARRAPTASRPNNNAPGFNPGFDSRRGAGNTNDLRGKILRIHLEADGSYTIPAGNLFAPGTAKTRPEIFAMGVRNPFRIDVDPATNSVSWGDYGPDAGAPDAERGPMGYVEWQTTAIDQADQRRAGRTATGRTSNYNEWNFATATPGPFFDCAAGAENNSRWNTGLDHRAAGHRPRRSTTATTTRTSRGPS